LFRFVKRLDNRIHVGGILSSDLTTEFESPIGPPLIGALLRAPVDTIRARMLDALHNAGFTDVAPAHFAVFRYPPPEGRRPSDAAADAGMTRQAMGYVLGQLEELGYLTREDDSTDHRSKRIHLTERGYAAAHTVRQAVREIEAELEAELGHEEFAQLRGLLVKLNATETIRERRPRTPEPPDPRPSRGSAARDLASPLTRKLPSRAEARTAIRAASGTESRSSP
jgi:DNA-binding MarR family transcriptional regulator